MNKKAVFNPLEEDFTVQYDINGDNKPVPFTSRAGEIQFFEEVIADHIIKHLVDKIANEREVSPIRADLIKEIRDEVSVNLWEDE